MNGAGENQWELPLLRVGYQEKWLKEKNQKYLHGCGKLNMTYKNPLLMVVRLTRNMLTLCLTMTLVYLLVTLTNALLLKNPKPAQAKAALVP